MSGAESTTEVTPTRRYEDHSLGPLGGQKVHKSVKFCIMAGTAMPRLGLLGGHNLRKSLKFGNSKLEIQNNLEI